MAFDIRIAGRLRRRLPIQIYTLICLVRAMRKPRLVMDVDDLWNTAGRDGAACWTQISRGLLRDLQSVAAASDVILILSLNWRDRLSGIDEIGVRVLHTGRQWFPQVLCKSDPCARQIVVVTAVSVQRYTPKKFTSAVAAMLCRTQIDANGPQTS